MKKQYFVPLCEEIKVSPTSELLTGSSVDGVYLPVGQGSDVTAD